MVMRCVVAVVVVVVVVVSSHAGASSMYRDASASVLLSSLFTGWPRVYACSVSVGVMCCVSPCVLVVFVLCVCLNRVILCYTLLGDVML